MAQRKNSKADIKYFERKARIINNDPHAFVALAARVDIAARILESRPDEAERLLLEFFEEAFLAAQSTVLPSSRLDHYRDPLIESGLAKLRRLETKALKLADRTRKALFNPDLTINGFTNPTSGGIRPEDPWGSGQYGASRDGGARTHAGVDYLGAAGSSVYAGIGGTLEVIGDGVRITGRFNSIMYTVRQLHITPTVANGRVVSGTQVATVADLTGQYPGIQNHCHIEIYQQPGDVRLDPTGFFGN